MKKFGEFNYKKKIFFLSFFLIFSLLNFKLVKIQGNSMSPILKNNSYIITDKYFHKLWTIQKNDILLLNVGNKEVVKKVVGFPNEKILVEGKEIKLSKNEIYVLGENLAESVDSREYGPLNIDSIIGKVIMVF